MGWVSSDAWSGPKDIQRYVTSREFLGPNMKLLRVMATSYGRHIWMAVENSNSNERIIVLILVEGNAYKDISESMGPAYYDCPLALLDLVPEAEGEYAKEWRESVRAHHAKKNDKFEIGQPVTVYGKPYTVKGTQKRSYLIESPEGRVYKCSAAKMHRVAT